MPEKRYEVRVLNVDWFSITYRTLFVLIILIFVALSISGYALYQRFFNEVSPEKKASDAIMEVANLITRIELSSTDVEAYLVKPKMILREARDYYRDGDYLTAFDYAIEAKDKALDILQGIEHGRVGVQKATITSVEGDVKIRKSNSFKWIEADERSRLYPGDMIRTGSNSSIRVMFFDGTGYTIGPNSLVNIDESYENPISKAKNIGVKLNSGELDLRTPHTFTEGSTSTVKSPTTLATLKERTEANMSFNPNERETVFSLYKGRAEVITGMERYKIESREQVVVDSTKKITSAQNLPDRVSLIFPPNRKLFVFDDTASDAIDFQWSRPKNTIRFDFQLALTSLFSNPLIERNGINNNFLILKDLNKGTYFWRVRGYYDNGEAGGFSSAASFRIVTSEERISMADTTPPILEVEKPLPFSNIILLSGKTEPGVLLTANNMPIDVDEEGHFKDFLTVEKEGLNTITIIAQDPSGNETITRRKVYIEVF
jgi:hypothetical protein